MSYISATAHFIHKNIPHSRILSTKDLTEHHTGKNIAYDLRNILREFEIDEHQIVAIASDNGANI